MGIDPGFASGAVAVLSEDLSDTRFFDIKDNLYELSLFFRGIDYNKWKIKTAILEKVGSSPMQGVTSALNFGRGIGWVEALLVVSLIPYEYCPPDKWLSSISGRPFKKVPSFEASPKERQRMAREHKKNIKQNTYDFCKRRFPNAELRSFNKDTNRADALAIAYYCWSKYRDLTETITEASSPS